MQKENNQLTSSCSVGMRDINALSAPISRIKTLRDDEGRRGFTLIELLVVVLIIGILAAIALPQYQKAVKRARFTEWVTTAEYLMKVYDVYMLNHGLEKTGWICRGDLDIDITAPWKCEGIYGFSNIGRWDVGCIASSTCGITVDTQYHADKSKGNSWAGGGWIQVTGFPGGKWTFMYAPNDPYVRQLACEWWKKKNKTFSHSGQEACNPYL